MWLPREISGLTVTTVYIPSRAHTELSLGKLFKAVNWQETACPEAASIVMVCAVGTGHSASSLYSSQDVSYTSTYKPSVGALGPAQSTYQQGVSYRPVQSTLPSSFDSRAYPYASSFKPSTSTSKPVQSGYQQKASDQPVQTAFQRVSSSQPVASSFQQVASAPPFTPHLVQILS
ncbi:hypothetical protein SRHO_G00275510 [Serrasalmus rhombeus]